MKKCNNCDRPLQCINVCRFCMEEQDPISLTQLLMLAGIIFILGMIFANLIR